MRAGAESLQAPIVVNAAGAWADEIARLAGIAPVGLVPCRRTAVLVDPPAGMTVDEWPFVNDIDEQFYFKPDAGSLFISPADETATVPGDAQPDEWDIAVAVDRVQAATTLQIHRLKARWAGLRTFAPDRSPVVGFSPEARRASSGLPDKAVMEFKRRRPYRGRLRPSSAGLPLPQDLARSRRR